MLGSRTDADAAAYIAAVEAAGATVSGAQASAVNDFYVSAKADNYYTSLKRLYLPIWGVAAANAIDMITGASGTFNGGVTHSAGYVQGNGTTGYFDLGESFTEIGCSDTSVSVFGGLKSEPLTASDATIIGVAPAAGTIMQLYTNGGSGDRYCVVRGLDNTTSSTSTSNSHTGIFVGSIDASNRRLTRRDSSGVTNFTNATTGGTLPSEDVTALRLGAPAVQYHGGEMILWGVGTSLSQANAEAFTLHLKNLWETATGLTLP